MKKLFLIILLISSFFFGIKVFGVEFNHNNDKVYVSGETIGLKINTGVMVTKMYAIQTDEGVVKPWENANIKIGDIITKINQININNADTLIGVLAEKGNTELQIELLRDNSVIKTSITPVYKNDTITLGIYVKDNMLGVGTMTFITKDSLKFASLGHQINSKLDNASGSIYKAEVTGIDKSVKGHAGSKKATIDYDQIGSISDNTLKGVYGSFTSSVNNLTLYSIKLKEEVKLGEATILTCIDGKKVCSYKIEITNLYKKTDNNIKGIKFKIVDEDLLDKAGGVIQGMSGSPIIQDNKLIGAVTHVIVNSPNLGYGIFVEYMLEELDYEVK